MTQPEVAIYPALPIPEDATLRMVQWISELNLYHHDFHVAHHQGWTLMTFEAADINAELPLCGVAVPGTNRELADLVPLSVGDDAHDLRLEDFSQLPVLFMAKDDISREEALASLTFRTDVYQEFTRPSFRPIHQIPRLDLSSLGWKWRAIPEIQKLYDSYYDRHWLVCHPYGDMSVMVRRRRLDAKWVDRPTTELPLYDSIVSPFRVSTVEQWFHSVISAVVAQKLYGDAGSWLDAMWYTAPGHCRHLKTALYAPLAAEEDDYSYPVDWSHRRLRVTDSWSNFPGTPLREEPLGTILMGDLALDPYMHPLVRIPESARGLYKDLSDFLAAVEDDEDYEEDD